MASLSVKGLLTDLSRKSSENLYIDCIETVVVNYPRYNRRLSLERQGSCVTSRGCVVDWKSSNQF